MTSFSAARREAISFKLIQWGIFCLICSFVAFPDIYQNGLDHIWDFLRTNAAYQLSFIETIETIFCYIQIESFFIRQVRSLKYPRVDMRPGYPDRPHMRALKTRLDELIIYIAPLLLLDLVLVKKYSGVSLRDITSSSGRDLSNISSVHPSYLYLNFHNFSLKSPFQLWRALPAAPPTSRRIVFEVATALFIYDFIFFIGHVIFHHSGIKYFQQLHNVHHVHNEIQPQITNQLDIFERLALILGANFALNLIGAHVLSRTLFIPAFLWMLVENHAGIDLKWGYTQLLPLGIGAGPKRHALHHKYGKVYYQPYLCWADDLLQWCMGESVRQYQA